MRSTLMTFLVCMVLFFSNFSVDLISMQAGQDTKDTVLLTYKAEEILSDANNNIVNNGTSSISLLRPRLFVRADEAKLGRGLTLSELRSRADDPAYQDWISYDGTGRGRGSMPAIAMQYLLTGEKKYALAVGDYLATTDISFGEHTSTAAAVYHSAIAFDWVRDALTDETARKISDDLVKGAEHLKGGVITPSINHNYTIVSLYGLAMSAVAIYGESDEKTQKSLEYIQIIDDLLTHDHMLLNTFQQKEGVWGEGNHYTPYVVYFPFLMTMRGLTTATCTDYFSLIREHYGNFIKPMSKFVIANFRPDFTLERIGDITGRVVPTGTFMRPLLELMASEIDDDGLQGRVRSFSHELKDYYNDPLVHNTQKWMMVINYDSNLPDEPSYKTLPLVMRLGKGSYEHIMFRNSWESDGTLISYISGDQYTHHQHLDKGHFLIYRKGGLAVDGGGYGRPMYGDNWANYSTRTIAHNNVLVYDPEEQPFTGTRGTTIFPDGGQRIQIGNQGHRNWQHYLEIRDSFGLNTAEVLAFDYDPEFNHYNYVKSDLGKAYGDNIVWMDRQLMYLPNADYLVVRDRVISGKAMEKYWLLHFEQTPAINGKIPATGITDYNGDSVVRSERTDLIKMGGKTVEYSGALFIRSLLPGERNISVIGGPGYEYYNRFVNKNFPNAQPFDPVIEPGNWRMETSTANPETNTFFLHALEITDADKQEMVATGYIESKNGKMAGALFLSDDTHYIVLFSNSTDERADNFQKTGLPVEYLINTTAPAIHVLAELEPEKRIKVDINGKAIGVFTTTSAGVLSFKDTGAGARNIKLEAEELTGNFILEKNPIDITITKGIGQSLADINGDGKNKN